MSSFRRQKNSPYWIACLTLPGGRTQRSTKLTDRRLAQRLCDEWQTAADKARQGRFVETQARNVLNQILAAVGQEQMSSETVESFLRRWLDGKGDGGTARRYKGTVEQLLKSLGAKRNAALTAIGHDDILKFIDSRKESGVAPKTLNVDVKTLGAAFNLARKLGLILSNPVEKALALRPIYVESSRRECFSPEQVKALINASSGDWTTLILLGFYTGARLADCANMRWENVSLAEEVIKFEPHKTRSKHKSVMVPLHPHLMEHLEGDRPETFLCPTLAGKPTGGKNGLSAQFKRIMTAASISTQSVQGKGIRRFARLSFHSLRHSFNSNLASAGVAESTRMALSGHSSVASAHYSHLDELPKLRAAVEKLPSLLLVE